MVSWINIQIWLTSVDLLLHYPLDQADLVRQEYEVLYEKTCAAKGAAQKNC